MTIQNSSSSMPLPGTSGESTALGAARAAWLERLQYPLVILFLLAFVVVGWLGRDPPMQAAGDDEFVYLALSHSLESGSYREIFRPTTPLHVQYPPAYPASLVAVRQIVGENLHAIRGVNLALGTLALGILFFAARRLAGVGLALAFLVLVALNRGVLTAGSLTSEGLFLCLSAASLAWTLEPRHAAPRRAAVAISLALLGFLTRSIGLALIIAMGAWLWSRRQRRALLAWALASVVVVGGWFAYSSLGWKDPTVVTYASDFTAGLADSDTSGGAVGHLLGRLWRSGVVYATTHMPHAMALPTIPGSVVDNWIWLVLSAVLMTIGFVLFWKRWRAAAVYVACYILFVLLWPWESGRLLVPMIPFGLLAFLLGARWATGFFPGRARGLVLGSLVAVLGIGALQGARDRLALYRDCNRTRPYGDPACYDRPKLWAAAAAEFVRTRGDSGDVIFTDLPASVHYLSGHQTEPAYLVWDAPQSAAEVMRARKVRYVLLTRSWQAQRLLRACAELRVEQSYPPEGMLLSLAGSAPDPDACPALRRVAALQLPR